MYKVPTIDDTIHHMMRAALAVGSQIMDVYRGDVFVEMKRDDSPATEAERRGHDTIQSVLRAFMNVQRIESYPIFSEEGAIAPYLQRAGWERYLLVDPLDGTKEFIGSNGEFTVNIALMDRVESDETIRERIGADASQRDVIAARRWIPVAGVVYAPATETLYCGYADGAWRWDGIAGLVVPGWEEGTRLPLARDTRPYTIVVSRNHLSPATADYIEERRREFPDLDLVTAGSSLKICRVAEGSADEYPRFAPTMEWDIAAGHAIARAVGCAVVSWDDEKHRTGDPLTYNKVDLRNPSFVVQRP